MGSAYLDRPCRSEAQARADEIGGVVLHDGHDWTSYRLGWIGRCEITVLYFRDSDAYELPAYALTALWIKPDGPGRYRIGETGAVHPTLLSAVLACLRRGYNVARFRPARVSVDEIPSEVPA